MLWPHFWVDEEKAEHWNTRTLSNGAWVSFSSNWTPDQDARIRYNLKGIGRNTMERRAL